MVGDKSLVNFQKILNQLNINLEIIETNSYKLFFDKLVNKNNFNIYWNKTYEPDYLKFDKYLVNKFESNKIKYKIFKGNILNDIEEVKKEMEVHLKYLLHIGETLKNFILKKFLPLKKNI